MRAVGIILAGGNNNRMKRLSEKRAIAAMPIAGSYRAIDFALSNMTNSGIQKVAVLTQYNARSLNEHLSSSKWWDFGRKQGGLFIFPPTITTRNSWWYRGTADAIYQNLGWLKRSHEPYVVIASGDGIYKLDYNKVLEYHIAKRADVTVVCTEVPSDEASRFGVVRLNSDGRIEELDEKPMITHSSLVSTGIYVIRRRLLIEMIERCGEEDRVDFVRDVLIRYRDLKAIYGYIHSEYWSNISTVESYFKTNMDFLDPAVRRYFFVEGESISTRIEDNPPAKYNPACRVSNSLVASGCIVNGVIEDSVIFKKVFVGDNCYIRNSIILNDVYIGDHTHIENCVVESGSTIRTDSRYVGDDGIRIVVEDNERYVM